MEKMLQTIEKLVDHQGIVYLSSIDEDGFPAMRAMLKPRKREGLHVFWLTTNTSSQKVAQYAACPKAGLYFCDRRFFRGVLLKGRIEVLRDEAARKMIWQAGDEQYYPQGVDDPDYSVLRFVAEKGRYYSAFKTKEFTL